MFLSLPKVADSRNPASDIPRVSAATSTLLGCGAQGLPVPVTEMPDETQRGLQGARWETVGSGGDCNELESPRTALLPCENEGPVWSGFGNKPEFQMFYVKSLVICMC